jgi:hypothetical protein
MKTRKQKHESSKEIKEKLEKAKIAIFTSFAQVGAKGLNVAEGQGGAEPDCEFLTGRN